MKVLACLLLLAIPLCLAQQQAPAPPVVPQPVEEVPAEPAAQEPAQQPVQRIEPEVIQPIQPADVPAEATEAGTDYRGPTILSRGGQPSTQRASELFTIQPFVTLDAVYDTGLATVGVDNQGRLDFESAYGAEATFGVTGARSWRHSGLAIDYRGAARHYSKKTFYDGSDHTLMLRYDNQVARRWLVSLTQGATSFSRGTGLPFGVVQGYDPTFGMLTGHELFDSRTNAILSSGQAVYQKSARLSFAMGASGFVVRRRSDALVGALGWSAIGDVAYRLGRYSTIGIEYDFSRFEYQGQYGMSDAHGLAVNYSRRLNRWWELSLRAGGLRVETSRVQIVQLDPAIAAIIGQTQGISAFHDYVYLPQYTARLTRVFQRSSLSVGYARTVTPGNGVYLTSGTEMFDALYTNRLSRLVAFSFGAGASRLKALSQDLANYRSYSGRAGVSFRLRSSLSALARVEFRSQSVNSTQLDRDSFRAAVGIGWTPGEYPVSVW